MRKTLAELNIHNFFYYERGKLNAIVDVPGIKVGHTTLNKGDSVRTGVSVIIPENFEDGRFIAGGFAFNANGEMTCLQYILEEGRLISPIFLTNTISLGDVYSAATTYYTNKVSIPIVGECWDGWLNDIWGKHVKAEHVFRAIETASTTNIDQGSVGAGTGMTSFDFKAGIGTSSRKVKILDNEYTIGVLVNNNMGREGGTKKYLRIGGVDVGKILGSDNTPRERANIESHQSSSILVVATNIPMDHRQLNRLAKHAVLGFGRVGLVSYTGSGDFVIAFSTASKTPSSGSKVKYQTEFLEESLFDDVFEALLEAVEESYLNSLLMAEDMIGRDGHTIKALPIDKLLPFLNK